MNLNSYRYDLPAKGNVQEENFFAIWKAHGVKIGYDELMNHYSKRVLYYKNETAEFITSGADNAPPFSISGSNEQLLISLAEMVQELLKSPATLIFRIGND